MFAFPAALRISVAVEPVDMRMQSNGLWAHAEQALGEKPKSGALFVFANKSRDRLKILSWDGTGVWLLANRLEQGLEKLAARLATPPQIVTYERTPTAPTERATPAERFANLPVKETITIEPAEVQAAPAAYERIGEEKTFEIDIVPPAPRHRTARLSQRCAHAAASDDQPG